MSIEGVHVGSVADLKDLDPDSPRTPSQQIADALRSAILIGTFAADEKLPSQHELAHRYRVARETVKAALRILHNDRLIVSRQGAGAFVRQRQGSPNNLVDILRTAFDRPHVTIDYAGFNGETLSKTLLPSLEDLAAGRLIAESFRLRMLLVDPTQLPGMPRPARLDQQRPHRDDRAIRRVFTGMLSGAVATLTHAVDDLAANRIVKSAHVEVRVHGLGPSFKAYLLNGERTFFGFYPVTTREYTLRARQLGTTLHHPSGWDATLFTPDDGQSATTGPLTSGPPFTQQVQQWYDSVWTTIARDYTPSFD